ncbi:MAG: CCA tRNA nucleotidyltransferase [Trueperaceae bacterium]|nr:CCA tRNA nucleotidyltransferase [Trueperaceae bacterium]
MTQSTADVALLAPGAPLADAVLVGGAVRDLLLGRRPADHDWLVAHPERSARALAAALDGSAFALDEGRGHWRVVVPGAPGAPSAVHDLTPPQPGGSGTRVLDGGVLDEGLLERDLRARDFTINAMAALPDGRIVDPTGGRADLEARVVRTASPESLRADTVRAWRAVRVAAQIEGRLEPATARRVAALAAAFRDGLALPAVERIRDELEATLATPRAGRALAAMDELGLLEHVLPELTAGRGVEQPAFHHLDVLEHQLEALQQLVDAFPDADLAVRWATLLHDVGKPPTRVVDDWQGGRARFHGHDRVGGDLAALALRRLRLPRARIVRVAALVRAHMRPLPKDERAARRFVHRLRPLLPDLLKLMIADREAARGPLASAAQRRRYRLALAEVVALLEEAPPPEPLLRGDDVMRLLGLRAGPTVGRALHAVEEARALGDVTDRAQAEAYVRRLAEAQGWRGDDPTRTDTADGAFGHG